MKKRIIHALTWAAIAVATGSCASSIVPLNTAPEVSTRLPGPTPTPADILVAALDDLEPSDDQRTAIDRDQDTLRSAGEFVRDAEKELFAALALLVDGRGDGVDQALAGIDASIACVRGVVVPVLVDLHGRLSSKERAAFASHVRRRAMEAHPATPTAASFSMAVSAVAGLDPAQCARVLSHLPGVVEARALHLEFDRRITAGTNAFASPLFDKQIADAGFGTASLARSRAQRNAAFVKAALPDLDDVQRARLSAALRERAGSPPRLHDGCSVAHR